MSNNGRQTSAPHLIVEVDTLELEELIHAICLLGIDDVHLEASTDLLPHLAAAAFAYPGPLPTGFQLCEPGHEHDHDQAERLIKASDLIGSTHVHA